MSVGLPIVLLVLAMLAGVPVVFALIGAGVAGIWMLTGDLDMVIGLLKVSPYRNAAHYTLLTVPMFILMAYMTSLSGMAQDLFDAVADWLSHLKGGLAAATVVACAIFGAMSGSSAATATVMSTVAMPNMQRLGYSDVLSSSTVAVGATLSILIPPSITMVVYGIATETSIGKLLLAGVLPGLLLALLLTISIFVWVRFNPALAPEAHPVPLKKRLRSLRKVWSTVLLITTLMLLLYTGIATPTELAALGALAATLMALFAGRLTWSNFIGALLATGRSTAMVFMILLGALIFGLFLTLSQVPQNIVATIADMNLNRWLVIAAIVVIYFVISMFMDELPLLLITLPVVFPLVMSLGFDPVWFGVVCMLMVAMGMIFPPVGLLVFVVSATAKVNIVTVFRGTAVLLIPIILAMVLLMIFPQIALWLPSNMR